MFWVPFTSHFIFGPQNLWAAHDDELFGHPKAIPTLISTGQKLSHIFWFDTFFLSAKYLHRFWHRIVCAEKRDLRNCENHILADATRNPFLSLEMSEKFDAKMNNMRQLKSGSSETDAVSLTKKNSGSQISTKIRPFFFRSCVFFFDCWGTNPLLVKSAWDPMSNRRFQSGVLAWWSSCPNRSSFWEEKMNVQLSLVMSGDVWKIIIYF